MLQHGHNYFVDDVSVSLKQKCEQGSIVKKHAYLIMAHNEFELLKKLIMALDDERADIYLHIDKKATDISLENVLQLAKKSNVYAIKRKRISWGGTHKLIVN